jgi:tripartite-type tricarboxylate transporter receptor subunit TctC
MVLGASPNVFVVPEQSEIKSMKEFIEKAKANPDKMNWTSSGAGTTPQLAGELIKLRTGIKMQHIPFPGAGPATNAVLAGTVDLYTANIGSVQGLIDGGKVRPIAVTSKTRWAPMPDVPTLDEIGIKDAESDTFQGVYVLAGTPQPVIDRLNKELVKIINSPVFKDKFEALGFEVRSSTPQEFADFAAAETRRWGTIIKELNIKAE